MDLEAYTVDALISLPSARNSLTVRDRRHTAAGVLYAARVEPLLSRTRAWTIALVATLAMTVSYIDRQTLAALAPTVKNALGIGHAQYGWLTSAFSISYLVGAPLAGWLLDRVGARRGPKPCSRRACAFQDSDGAARRVRRQSAGASIART